MRERESGSASLRASAATRRPEVNGLLRDWRAIVLAFLLLLTSGSAWAQTVEAPESDQQRLLEAAHKVEQQVSAITGLKAERPIPKSLKSREQIRQYVVERMSEQYPPAKLRGDRLALEKFGLLPKNFPLEKTLIDVLSEQVAAYYDPKRKEFYIADWIPVELQRPILAHELTHALQDQHYGLTRWLEEVKENDDAYIARDAVLEGSATAVMFEYLFAPMGRSVADMTDLDELLRAGFLAGLESQEVLKNAPPYLREVLLFPYLDGSRFFQRILNVSSWKATDELFARPPRSTREILHPDVYLAQNPRPNSVTLPDLGDAVPPPWKRLDENVIGEFGLKLVLAQYLDPEEAGAVAGEWQGDRYQIYEGADEAGLLVHYSRWRTPAAAGSFFDAYVRTRAKRYARERMVRSESTFHQAETEEGGVIVSRRGEECLIVEGATLEIFRAIEQRVWPSAARLTGRVAAHD